MPARRPKESTIVRTDSLELCILCMHRRLWMGKDTTFCKQGIILDDRRRMIPLVDNVSDNILSLTLSIR